MKTKSFFIISIFAFSGITALAATYDLGTDWSDVQNPNGVWSLTEGNILMPSNFGWDAGGIPTSQHIWGIPDSTSPVTRPIWFKAATNYLDPEAQTGDVITYSPDTAEGIKNDMATWTSPFTGIINISGEVWNARGLPRSESWSIWINGVPVTGGRISYNGIVGGTTPTSPSNRLSFAAGSGGSSVLTNVAVTAGDTVSVVFRTDTQFGDYDGLRFTVTQVFTRPSLTVTPFGSSIMVSWPYPSTGFLLQQNDDLNTTNWITSGFTVTTNALNNSIIAPSSVGNLFFRLKQ